uniref:Uncharacterized protein n=1 Tax=Streptomyces sp. NBC_00049 TaxID=2903617 RepID=A0AAU2K1F0_9ACTN
MPESDEGNTAGPDAVRRHDGDPRGSRAPGEGRPGRRRGYHRARAWLGMALGVAAAVAGATLPSGLLLAAGLVASALAVNLFGAPHPPRRRP